MGLWVLELAIARCASNGKGARKKYNRGGTRKIAPTYFDDFSVAAMLGGLCIVLIAIASHVAGSSIVGIGAIQLLGSPYLRRNIFAAASPIIFNTTDSFFVTINSTTGASIPLATVANGTVSNFNTLFTTSENYSVRFHEHISFEMSEIWTGSDWQSLRW